MVLLVGIDNEAGLLQKMYDQSIVSRQYLLAWMEDSHDILAFGGSSGSTDYLSSVRITWDDSRFDQGPIGIANRDILHDPRYEPWREEAL